MDADGYTVDLDALRDLARQVRSKLITIGGSLNLFPHLMTMSTCKSLGGPAGGLIVTNEADIAARLDAIAFPGMTANFDAAKSAALAMSLLDWVDHGAEYARAMADLSLALAQALAGLGLPVFARALG
ncbi:hypothetical protein METH_02685 [Leisingera methylohalidivorans DSM 14336]|uniref:Uncharacterized protein n=1 Tax=Leisingera methylohalidivorans DSM 14336 TaxID=999552 RepID=V9W109_9RHOB|nr:hypothetical protein METH_02685 [Leisingera methylohalidivorans DSM 14336]